MDANCTLFTKLKTLSRSDGIGGIKNEYKAHTQFYAVCRKKEMRKLLAEDREMLETRYTLAYSPSDVDLKFGDVVRGEDGRLFLIESNPLDRMPPKNSSINFVQITLKLITLPSYAIIS